MAGGRSIESILGYTPLLKVVQQSVSGVRNPLPESFMRPTDKVIGDSGMMTLVTGERRLASTSTYGSPAKQRGLRPLARKPVKLISSFESQALDPLVLGQLMSFEKYEQDKGASVVGYQVREFAKLQANLRIACAVKMLGEGVVYRDSNGFVLPTSSGENTNLRISSGMAAAHQGQLNDSSFGGTLIGTTWSNPTAPIPQDMVNLQERAGKETGYELKVCFYGKNVGANIMKNDNVQDWMIRNPGFNNDWTKSSGIIPQGLFGFRWIPMWHAAFKNEADDTAYAMWDGDLLTVTPDFENVSEMEEWWQCVEGSTWVPRTVNIVGTQGSFTENNDLKYGMYAYGQLTHNPPGITNYQGDIFLHYIRNPDVIYQIDTDF